VNEKPAWLAPALAAGLSIAFLSATIALIALEQGWFAWSMGGVGGMFAFWAVLMAVRKG
jgi:hypothetical protein